MKGNNDLMSYQNETNIELKKKFKEIIKNIFAIILSLLILLSFTLSINTAHLDSCDDEDCMMCFLIHMAIDIINNIFKVESDIGLISKVFIIQTLTIKLCIVIRETLTSQNVRLN